ncbi:MAG: linear amide C-N hydrolase [Candidatus Omnitrophota bacterium]|nr:linear amide C-N hydrolase [Candidatus Omnitrophota bacterium]
MYDNPVGVATNSPPFGWHLANLRNYVNLTNVNVDSLKLGDYVVTSIGQGSGLHGLPGDYTPPSRFIRATAMVYAAQPVADAVEGANLVFHILNTVDIPMGASVSKSADGSKYYDHTTWTTGHDVTNKIFYFRTYGNLTIRKIDMKALDFAAPDVKRIEMMGGEPFLDVTKDAK